MMRATVAMLLAMTLGMASVGPAGAVAAEGSEPQENHVCAVPGLATSCRALRASAILVVKLAAEGTPGSARAAERQCAEFLSDYNLFVIKAKEYTQIIIDSSGGTSGGALSYVDPDLERASEFCAAVRDPAACLPLRTSAAVCFTQGGSIVYGAALQKYRETTGQGGTDITCKTAAAAPPPPPVPAVKPAPSPPPPVAPVPVKAPPLPPGPAAPPRKWERPLRIASAATLGAVSAILLGVGGTQLADGRALAQETENIRETLTPQQYTERVEQYQKSYVGGGLSVGFAALSLGGAALSLFTGDLLKRHRRHELALTGSGVGYTFTF